MEWELSEGMTRLCRSRLHVHMYLPACNSPLVIDGPMTCATSARQLFVRTAAAVSVSTCMFTFARRGNCRHVQRSPDSRMQRPRGAGLDRDGLTASVGEAASIPWRLRLRCTPASDRIPGLKCRAYSGTACS